MKNVILERVPLEHILVRLYDVLYPFIDRVQVSVSDDNLDLISVWTSYESGIMGTDGYFKDLILGQVETSHFTVHPDERIFGQRTCHFPHSSR